MGVTVIGIEDTIGGAVKRLGESVGDALDATVFAKGLKEKELRKEPGAMQGLVLTVRAAQRAGIEAMDGLANGLNVNVEFLDEILAFTPTLQQATEERAILNGAANAAADAMFEASRLESATANAMFNAGKPALDALAFVTGAQLEIGQNIMDLDILTARRENGVVTTILKTEKLTSELEAATAERVLDYFNNIDQTTEQGQHDALTMGLAMRLPAQLQHLQFHENMDFQESLALFNAARASNLTDADKIGLGLDLETAWQTAVDRLQEAEESGDDDFRNIAIQDLNNVRLMIQKANEAGLIFDAINTTTASLGRKFFGGVRLELAQDVFNTPGAAAFVDNFFKQHVREGTEPTVEELAKHLSSEEVIQSGMLSPSQRKNALDQFPAFLAKLDELETSDIGSLLPTTAAIAGVSAATGISPQAIGTGLEAIGFIWDDLSEALRGAVDFLGQSQQRARGSQQRTTSGTAGPF